MSMGEHTEVMAKEWNIGRAEQDQLAYESHVKGAAAWKAGFFDDLVVPFNGLTIDNNLRADADLQAMAKLRTAYDKSPQGTLTAGNSTPLTDGAACVLLGSEDWAKARGLPVLAYLALGERGGGLRRPAGPREGLLMAPTYAVPQMLERAGHHAAGLRYLRNPRSLRRAGAVHAEGLGIGGLLPPEARARRRSGRSTARK